MSDHNLPIRLGTTGVRATFAALVALGMYACGEVSSDPAAVGGAGNGGSAGASAAGSGGSGGVSASAGSSGAGGSAGLGGSAGSAGSGSGSGGTGGTGGSGGTGSGTGGGSSADPDAGFDPDAALPDGGELSQELISNRDFESGISPWSAVFGGTLAVTTEQARGGLQSAKLSGRTNDFQGAHYDVTDLVTPGAAYTLTAFARISGASSTATLKATARVTCASQEAQYVTIRQLTGNDSSWTELTGNLTVPSSETCNLIELLVYIEGPPAEYDLYVDDVSMLPL